MKKFLIVVLLFLFPGFCFADSSTDRGLFVSLIDKKLALSSRESIDELIDFAVKTKMKTLFVQIYRGNKTFFPSKVGDAYLYDQAIKKIGEDPFNLLMTKAHQHGIEVHAWLNLLSLGGNDQAPLIKKYGTSILTTNLEPKKELKEFRIDNQYFLEPSDVRVQHELLVLVDEILNRYPTLDGIQFDYIRYPDVNPHYGYSKINQAAYKKVMKVKVIDDQSESWQQWKRDQVTILLKKLVARVNQKRPHLQISTTGCLSYVRAMKEAFQDWPLWINSQLVDFVTIMNYPVETAEYKKHIVEAKAHVDDFSKVNIAVGSYKFLNTPVLFGEHFKACTEASPRECTIFHYGNFLENPALTEHLIND